MQLATYNHRHTDITTTTLNREMMERFISFLDNKPTTVKSYAKSLKQLFIFLAENQIKNPQRSDIIAYRDHLKANYKNTTVQAYMTSTRLFFRWLASEGIYPNVAEHIKGATITKENKKDYLTSTQMKAVLSSIDTSDMKGLRDYAMIALMATGGLRTIEVARANVEDLQTSGDNTVLYVHGKGRDDKAEYIKISPKVEGILRQYLKTAGINDPKAPIFQSLSNNSKGKALTTRSISGAVKERLISAGYDSERLTAHSMRHTAVTLSLLGGATLQEAQQHARHSNIATTQIYAHNLDRAQNPCAEAVTSAIF